MLIALEYRWEVGILDATGTVSLAAMAVQQQGEGAPDTFSGTRRFVGELSIGTNCTPLSTGVIETVSQLTVKHAELVDAAIATSGLDLIAMCWPQT